jgi:hypothetical protein
MKYIITCGDEGVQINEGTRLAIVGAGLQLEGFSDIVSGLKKVFGDDLRIAASEENAWVKEKLELDTWEQANASGQQQIEALADAEGLLYAGNIPFADPQELEHGIKAHMVRPHGIHIATKITFTVGGGEEKYHLGQYLISAEWINEVPFEKAKELIAIQVAHYQSLSNGELSFDIQTEGELGQEIAAQNQQLLEKMGYSFPEKSE